MSIHVDHDALTDVADSLSAAAFHLETVGDRLPGEPDAGIGTGPLLAIISRLLANAGHLVDGLSAAGNAVHEINSAYSRADLETADQIVLEQWVD